MAEYRILLSFGLLFEFGFSPSLFKISLNNLWSEIFGTYKTCSRNRRTYLGLYKVSLAEGCALMDSSFFLAYWSFEAKSFLDCLSFCVALLLHLLVSYGRCCLLLRIRFLNNKFRWVIEPPHDYLPSTMVPMAYDRAWWSLDPFLGSLPPFFLIF